MTAESEQTRQDENAEPRIDWARVRFLGEQADRKSAATRWRMRVMWRWLAVAAVLALIVLAVWRQPLANLIWPDTRIQHLLDQGDAALRAGKLSAPDGSGARQYFEAAQALDTDRSEAGEGLARVANAALARAGRELDEGNVDQARVDLDLAVALQAPRAQAARIAERLRTRTAAAGSIEPLLAQARQAQAQGRLDGDASAALPLYQRILELQPNHLAALEGREDALTDLLQEARELLKQGKLVEGGKLINHAIRYDPGHVDLPASQAALARAIETRLANADRDRARSRLEDAVLGYQDVLQVAPEDARAKQGLERTGAAYAQTARREAGDYRFDAARASLAQARALTPQSPAIAEAELALQRAVQSQATQGGKRISPLHRETLLKTQLDAMAQAESRGDWITPPGESAFDKLRAAQALAPDDPRVRNAAARVLPSVRQCFEQEWRANRVRRAQGCLAAWQTLRPSDAALPEARRRMAQKWIAVGDERLGAGDIAFAHQALSEARALDARAPGLDDFAERVRLARATTP